MLMKRNSLAQTAGRNMETVACAKSTLDSSPRPHQQCGEGLGRASHHGGGRGKGGALELAEKLVGTVILGIDSHRAAHDRQKLDDENQCSSLSPRARTLGEGSAWALSDNDNFRFFAQEAGSA